MIVRTKACAVKIGTRDRGVPDFDRLGRAPSLSPQPRLRFVLAGLRRPTPTASTNCRCSAAASMKFGRLSPPNTASEVCDSILTFRPTQMPSLLQPSECKDGLAGDLSFGLVTECGSSSCYNAGETGLTAGCVIHP